MDNQDKQEFNQRLSHWIASQGFWFQLRHSLAGGGGVSSATFHFARLAIRLVIVFAIVAAGGFVFLSKRVGSESFQNDVRASLTEVLGAEETEVSSLSRSNGKGVIRRLGIRGGEGSIFDSLEATRVKFDMKVLDGVLGRWDLGTVECNRLDMELKAGAGTEDEAALIAAHFFEGEARSQLLGVRAATARISWGYFERTYGEISGSAMTANRTKGGWRFTFEGGSFSQNWLRNLRIEKLVIFCSPDEGIVLEEGRLIAGEGRVEMRGVRVVGGSRPALSGSLVLSSVPLAFLLPADAANLVSGTVSGELNLGGSTNTAEGVTISGRIDLQEGDSIMLNHQIPILDSLDVVDVFNSYKRLEFDRGGFELISRSGELEIRELEMLARGRMGLSGSLSARRPDEPELHKIVGRSPERSNPYELSAVEESELTMTLRRQTGLADELRIAQAEAPGGFFGGLEEARRLRRDQTERARRSFSFGGVMSLRVPSDAFERGQALKARFPQDPTTGMVVVEIPLHGDLAVLTRDLAEEILRLGAED